MPLNTTVDSIIASGLVGRAYRVLTTDLVWPAGDPPFASGSLQVAAIPETPAHYSAATFVATDWTDVTDLVTAYHYRESLDSQVAQLTLTVPRSLGRQAMDLLFRAMRAVVVQERCADAAGHDTGWLNRAWCISTGYQVEEAAGRAADNWTVTALDVLMLANLDPLGADSGNAVYQADSVRVDGDTPGSLPEPGYGERGLYVMPLVAIRSDAYEYGVTWGGGGQVTSIPVAGRIADTAASFDSSLVGATLTIVREGVNYQGTISAVVSSTVLAYTGLGCTPLATDYYFIGGIHPNWSDRPGPQFWALDVPLEDVHNSGVPLAIAGDAVQAVFGEGILRLGRSYVATDPGDGPDFSVGLGYGDREWTSWTGTGYMAGTIPIVGCRLYRFAHGETQDSSNVTLPAEQVADQEVTASAAGSVTVAAADFTAAKIPPGLTLWLLDGTGKRYATTGYTIAGSDCTIALADATAEIAVGSHVTYGDCNLVTDLTLRWLLESGLQVADDSLPFYAATPEQPQVGETAVDLTLPPQVFDEDDQVTRLGALEELRREYAVMPSYLTRANPDGQVETTNVRQLFDDETGPCQVGGAYPVIPVTAIGAADLDRLDAEISTRVVAKGRERQAGDITQEVDGGGAYTTTIEDAPEADPYAGPGEPWVPAYCSANINGYAVRSGATGGNWEAPLEQLFSREIELEADMETLRPFGWFLDYSTAAPPAGSPGVLQAVLGRWCGQPLMVLTFPRAVAISQLDLDLSNDCDRNDEYGAHNAGSFRFDYWDDDGSCWRQLVAGIQNPVKVPNVVRLTAEDDFSTRAAVTTTKIRLVCDMPFVREYDQSTTMYCFVGLYLRRLYVWTVDEIRGVAEVGTDAPFTGAAWAGVRTRMRQRTHVVREVADWANTQELADGLALDWLYERTRNLAPRNLSAIRPDVRVTDTIRPLLPDGVMAHYPDTIATPELSGWRLWGLSAANSDHYALYYALTESGGTKTISLYSDAARTELVAAGSRSSDGVVTIAAENGSGLSGQVTLEWHSIEATGVVAPPTYLVIGLEQQGQGGRPGPEQLTVVNYAGAYFEE